MLLKPSGGLKNCLSWLATAGAVFLFCALLIWPAEAFQGACYGIRLWAAVLLPSLLPFFILAEILFSIGFVKLLGVLLEPLMRPLFNLPGAASFAVVMGFTSGFPMGAVLSSRLYENNECTASECERLAAFTNNSSPLFILSSVSVGMFGDPAPGVVLASAHYCSNILLGILLGFLAPRRPKTKSLASGQTRRSLRTMLHPPHNRPPWGKILSNAVRGGINNITLIAGFVILFAVITRILQTTGLMAYPIAFCGMLLAKLGFDTQSCSALATGFWEMTLGLSELSATAADLREKIIVSGIIMGWSGLSIQAQVIGVLADSGIRIRCYLLGRIVQGALAALLSFFFLRLYPGLQTVLSVPAQPPRWVEFPCWENVTQYLAYLSGAVFLLLGIVLILAALSILLRCAAKIKELFYLQ